MTVKTLVYTLPIACALLICTGLNLGASGSAATGLGVLGLATIVWFAAFVLSAFCLVKGRVSHGIAGLFLVVLGVPVLSVVFVAALMLVVSPEHRERIAAQWTRNQENSAYEREAMQGNTLKPPASPIALQHKPGGKRPLEVKVSNEYSLAWIAKPECREVHWSRNGEFMVLVFATAVGNDAWSVRLTPTLEVLDQVLLPPGAQLGFSQNELVLLDNVTEQLLILDPSNFEIRSALAVPKSEVLLVHPSCNLAVLPSLLNRARLIDVAKREQIGFLTAAQFPEAGSAFGANRLDAATQLGCGNCAFSEDGKTIVLDLENGGILEVKDRELQWLRARTEEDKNGLKIWSRDRTPAEASSSNGYKDIEFGSATGFFQVRGEGLLFRQTSGEYSGIPLSARALSPFADVAVGVRGSTMNDIDELGTFVIVPTR